MVATAARASFRQAQDQREGLSSSVSGELVEPRIGGISIESHDPAVLVLGGAALDRDELVAQPLGGLAGSAAADGELAVMAGDLADRSDDRGGAAGEGLGQLAALGIRAPLVDRVALLAHRQAFLAGER